MRVGKELRKVTSAIVLMCHLHYLTLPTLLPPAFQNAELLITVDKAHWYHFPLLGRLTIIQYSGEAVS